jgi:predicted phosphodiesterase
MRIAFVSDIHGNLPALEAVAADIARRGVDAVVNLGDNLSGPLLPKETAQYLIASGWLSLAGNHDRALLDDGVQPRSPSDQYAHGCLGSAEFDWLRTLRSTARWAADVFLCHGTPTSDLTYFLETVAGTAVRLATAAEIETRLAGECAALIACGHSHVPRAVRTATAQLLVNPGSVGLPAYADDDPPAHLVETGAPDARYAIAEQTLGHWTAELLSVDYDYRSMAALARRNGRPDWEFALLTGRAK